MDKRLLVITPVHNEAAHVRRLVASVAAQTRPPDVWLVVDDGSTDETWTILQELCSTVGFMRAASVPRVPTQTGGDRLAAGLEAHAFNWALRTISTDQFDFIGKLDGDIELAPGHYQRLLREFESDSDLGIAGSMLTERSRGQWRCLVVPREHVHGAVKLYSRECFAAIGGMRPQLGWDIVDEASARLHGFSTRSLPDLVARHHRHIGSAQGRLRGHARTGESAWIANYPPLWIGLRSIKMAGKWPYVLSAVAFVFGYVRAAASRVGQVEDEELRVFMRSELSRRLRRPLAIRP